MKILVAMILGCIGGGVFAMVKRTLPIGPRRKVIDRPAIVLGIILIILPFANAALLVTSQWIARTYFQDSKNITHWSLMAPLIAFPLSIAGCLTLAKRWSVPNHYDGDWVGYTPYQRKHDAPDLSFLDSPQSDSGDDG